MTKKKSKNNYDDSWMYILLLTTVTILTYSLSSYTFDILGVSLSYSLFNLFFLSIISSCS